MVTEVKKGAAAKAEVEETKTNVPVAADSGSDLATTDNDPFFEGAGEGLEDFSQSDMLTPYIRIVQALSKELQKNHAKYLESAEQGQFVNSATRRLYDGEKGFYAIPISFGHRYVAWKPKNGGIAQDYGDDASIFNSIKPEADGYKRIDSDGNEVVDSLQFFALLVDTETFEYELAVLNFAGSQAKKGKGWSTTINNRMERHNGKLIRPAIYFYSYLITSVPESNDQGSWYGFSIAEGPKVKDITNGGEIFTTAKGIRERITAGEIKAAVEDPNESGESGGPEKAF